MVNDSGKTLSKAIFGNAYFFAAAIVIAKFNDGSFTQRTVARRLSIPDNLVAPTLKRLSVAELIKQSGETWRRVQNPFWQIVEDLNLQMPELGGDEILG
jgi:hypothetical protein